MAYRINPDGTASYFSGDQGDADGERIFPTLAGAVVHGGTRATAFSRPIRLLTLCSGEEFSRTNTFVPRYMRSDYRIAAEGGALITPPRWPPRQHDDPDTADAIHWDASMMPAFHLLKGWAQAQQGNPIEAVSALEAALELDPTVETALKVREIIETLRESAQAMAASVTLTAAEILDLADDDLAFAP